MTESSRRGKRISRRACDLCRDRRSQCTFPDGNTTSCRRCLEANVPCLFLTDRRPRGPPSRRIAEDRKRAALATNKTPPPLPPSLLAPDVTVDLFAAEDVLNTILDDFIVYIYPLMPLIHVPTFNIRRFRREYNADPEFLRLCLSLAAATIAHIPRNVRARYGSGRYLSAGEMVDRASYLFQLSRLTTEPAWQNNPTIQSMVVCIPLSTALLCTNRVSAGWSFANDAISAFCFMKLGSEDSYVGVSLVDQELAKRAFWLLFIMQAHHVSSNDVPHTGLVSDPRHTDWEFLMPAEVDDMSLTTPTPGIVKATGPPIISGFIALIKVFVLFIDTFEKVSPGLSLYHITPGPIASRLLGQIDQMPTHVPPHQTISQLESLHEMLAHLDFVLAELPQVLRLPQRGGQAAVPDNAPNNLLQFEIMRANVHVTAIHFQSLILEACLGKVSKVVDSPDVTRDDSISNQLRQIQESIAHQLLGLIECSPPQVFEYNGLSMIKKIREVAVTFLDGDPTEVESPYTGDKQHRRGNYLKKCIEILATVDYMSEIEALTSQLSGNLPPTN